MKNKINLLKIDQINGSMCFSNSPLKIIKFDAIDFKNGVELRVSWRKRKAEGRERKRVRR
jgi:hypothetical protein